MKFSRALSATGLGIHATVLFCVLAFQCNAQVPSSPLMYRPQWFDVLHYDIELTVDSPELKYASGKVDVIFDRTEESDAVFPIFYSGVIDSAFFGIDRVEFDKHKLPDMDEYYFGIRRPASGIGTRDTLTMYFHAMMEDEGGTSPWGGVHFQDSVLYAMGVGFHNAFISAAHYWFPCYDHPSDKASFTLQATIPRELDVVSNGIRTGDYSADKRTVTWSNAPSMSTYLMTFAIAPYVQVPISGSDSIDVPVEIYAQRRDSSMSSHSFKLVPRMLRAFEGLYTKYPSAKAGYCLTSLGAMEHMGMICYPSGAVSADTVNTVAAHELAHQWFGDLVTALDFRDTWLSESFATYSESAWIEHLRDHNRYLSSVAFKASTYITSISKQDGVVPIYNFPHETTSNFPETIYQKGAVVLAMLRANLGDSTFYRGLRRYLEKYSYKNATTKNFEEAMEEVAGVSLDTFFAEWIYGIGWPIISTDVFTEGGRKFYKLTQTQRATRPQWPIFTTIPLNVVYTSPATGVAVDTVLYFDSMGTLTIETPSLSGTNIGTRCRALIEVGKTTSIEDGSDSRNIVTIHPNPANSNFVIQTNGVESSIACKVVGLDGKIYIDLNEVMASDPIDSSGLPAGSYTIVIEASGAIHTLPLSIIR